MLPCRQYHSYRKYKNRVSVAAKAIFLKEISKGFIIGHPSITVRERATKLAKDSLANDPISQDYQEAKKDSH